MVIANKRIKLWNGLGQEDNVEWLEKGQKQVDKPEMPYGHQWSSSNYLSEVGIHSRLV